MTAPAPSASRRGPAEPLQLGPGFEAPIELMIQKTAVLARTGAGKTNVVAVVIEEVLDRAQQVVSLDPKGDLWGLRSSADGSAAGYPITVLGGDHGDLPLEPSAGAVIADVAAEGASLVIDLSAFTNGERNRFVTDFAERFYRAKAKHVSPVLLVIDEADEICPQVIRSERGEYPRSRMVGAVERIVKRGRFRGIGTLLVTQRSASLNKDVLTQTEILVVMQTTSPQDRKAIDEWVEQHPDQERRAELLAGMAALRKGEAFVWSPTFLDAFRRVQFRMRRTFDAGRDVRIGEMRDGPRVIAPVDLAALGERMRATVERARRDDPAELRRTITALRAELAARPAPAVEERVVDRPVVTAEAVAAVERLAAAGEAIAGAGIEWNANSRHIMAGIASALSAAPSIVPPRGGAAGVGHVDDVGPFDGPAVRAGVPTERARARGPQDGHGDQRADDRPARTTIAEGITARQQRFLDAAATLTALGVEVSRETVAGWIGLHPRGGSVGEELKALVDAGLIEMDRGRITVTDHGAAAAGYLDPAEAIERAKGSLTPRQRRIFDIAVGAHPGEVTKTDVAERMNLHERGGSFGEDIARLRGRGLIDYSRGVIRARDFLFAR